MQQKVFVVLLYTLQTWRAALFGRTSSLSLFSTRSASKNSTISSFQKLTPEEVVLIDRVAKDHNNMAAEVDLELVRALYRRGLVYFDVPVYSDDRFSSTSPPCGASFLCLKRCNCWLRSIAYICAPTNVRVELFRALFALKGI
jgi:hypothetical protein